ncbi:hypothetical protein AB0F30_17120 [Streptomyces sp. NPDC029006]|uniref:hypothetical protein n=1 Tax=Streptomyces sp. NPDC029006 TaxID=3155467 RepID=UPI0033DA0409
MDAEELLHTWLAGSTLRPSTQAEYLRELAGPKGFLTWCRQQHPPIDALTARPVDIAAWSAANFLHPYLKGLAFTPDTLADLAEQHPDTARSHDRRITALTMYYKAAKDRGIITLPPSLQALRSGVTRPAGAKNKLDRMERAVLFTVIGGWGPDCSRHWRRDRLAVYLLLEGLRPAEVIRIDTRHLYPQPDGTWEIRAPDEHEVLGPPFTLEPLTSAALRAYLDVRPEPADPAAHTLLLNAMRQPLQSRWPNKLVGDMIATEPLLATREPTVTADTIAHTGFWDTPDSK